MKNITIAGGIGKNAETRRTQDGTPVTGFSVAVDDRTGKEKSTMWFDVSMWGNRGERLAQYLTKGTKVAVTGELGARQHEGKTYLTVKADNITLLGGSPKSSDSGQESYSNASKGGEPEEDFDSIPF